MDTRTIVVAADTKAAAAEDTRVAAEDRRVGVEDRRVGVEDTEAVATMHKEVAVEGDLWDHMHQACLDTSAYLVVVDNMTFY